LKTAKSANESGPDPCSSTWTDLVGPEYAAVLRPYRKLILVGGVGIFVGFAAGIFWVSHVGHVSQATGILGGFAFDVPGLATLGVGLVLQTRLSYKINRDLWAAKLPTPGRSPDLRNKSRFLYWSRHFGVTSEQVQEAGRRAAAAPSGAREPSAPDGQVLWDLGSKKRGDGDRADAE
jgi:hypothetical protein